MCVRLCGWEVLYLSSLHNCQRHKHSCSQHKCLSSSLPNTHTLSQCFRWSISSALNAVSLPLHIHIHYSYCFGIFYIMQTVFLKSNTIYSNAPHSSSWSIVRFNMTHDCPFRFTTTEQFVAVVNKTSLNPIPQSHTASGMYTHTYCMDKHHYGDFHWAEAETFHDSL